MSGSLCVGLRHEFILKSISAKKNSSSSIVNRAK